MRLQLSRRAAGPRRLPRAGAGALLLGATLPILVAATPTWEARTDLYVDQDLAVISPSAAVAVDLPRDLRLDGSYAVHVVSGATPLLRPDGLSGATRFTEARQAIDLGLGGVAGPLRIAGRWGGGFEPDFQQQTLTLSAAGDLSGALSLSGSYRVALERQLIDPGGHTWQRGQGHSLDLALDAVPEPRTRLRVLLSAQLAACDAALGCHASPYRFVPVAVPDGHLMLRERHPTRRGRLAVAGRISRSLRSDLALHAGYRFYGDGWGVVAHTGDLEFAAELLDEALILRAEARVTGQGPASFYRSAYATEDEVPGHVTGDRELAGLITALFGVRLEGNLFALRGPWTRLSGSVRLAHAGYHYPDYPAAPFRSAWLVGLGIDAGF